MHTNKRIGLHVRLDNSIVVMAQQAIRMELPFFQCFLLSITTNKLVSPSQQEMQEFIRLRRDNFANLYLHGSYWINLASLQNNGYSMLRKELKLAKQLEFTHIVLHPGTAKGAREKNEGIDALALMLNKLLFYEQDIKIILENTAHGNLSVGSDLEDFHLLLQKLDQPERISFCIDTSHAHAFGYDITDAAKQHAFVQLLDELVGLNRIVLIHLNDTKQKRGSRIDRHDIIGQGQLGDVALHNFIMHPGLINIPVLLELPALPEQEELALFHKVINWNKK
jgi:deoxyribonuclease-4